MAKIIKKILVRNMPKTYSTIKRVLLPLVMRISERKKIKRKEQYKKNALSVFKDFALAFKDAKIDFWLMYGTLIGAVREHDFISHDADIDVGVLNSVDFQSIDSSLKKYGFTLYRRIDLYAKKFNHDGFELTYSKEGVSIDIFVFEYIDQNTIMTCEYSKTYQEIHYDIYEHVKQYVFPFTGLMDYSFLGIDVKIPQNYDELLRANYGDYMTPDPNWDTSKDRAARDLEGAIGIVRH